MATLWRRRAAAGPVQLPEFYVYEDLQAGRCAVMQNYQPADTAVGGLSPQPSSSAKVSAFVDFLAEQFRQVDYLS